MIKSNKLQKKITAATAQPVNLGKAESMMQRMGWSGGALGRTGEGLVEPITPNAVYALQTRGFGQIEEAPKKKRKKGNPQLKGPVESLKEILKTNALLLILEFVKNEKEIELIFENTLNDWERKAIHMLVEMINNGESDRIKLSTDAQKDIFEQICECNVYELATESEGMRRQRTLHLYKEAPEHVFLVKAADLRPEEEDNEEQIVEKSVLEQNGAEDQNIEAEHIIKEVVDIPAKESIIVDDKAIDKNEIDLDSTTKDVDSKEVKNVIINVNDDNVNQNSKNSDKIINSDNINEDFNLDSISKTRNNDGLDKADSKNDANKDTKPNAENVNDETKLKDVVEINVIESLIEYFVEFLQDDKYTELRFLGAFSCEEIGKINEFINGIHICLYDQGSLEYEEVTKLINWQDYFYEIKEDCNGSIVFHKSRRKDTFE